uniref:GCVT N-terminal domain-containing protein n=1 Tax=Glycine max TaxID=3847 RepID=A0A0R0JWS9_SOYBN
MTTTVVPVAAAATWLNHPPNQALTWRLSVLPRNAAFLSHHHLMKEKKKKLMSWSIGAQPSPFDLSPPPIDHDFLDTVKTAGGEISGEGIIETFHNDDEALAAVDNGVVVVDLSHFGRIRVSGEDRIQFLHNQSTANFESLHEGQGCDTVFVTPTARTIDIAHAWLMKNAITLVVSPETCTTITEMLNKYIFFADKVEIQDITKQTSFFVLVGPKSGQVMENLNLGDLVGKPYGTHLHFNVDKQPITIGVGNIISEDGFSLLMSPAAAASIWKAILSQGAIPMGSNAWNKLRIIRGPLPEWSLQMNSMSWRPVYGTRFL